MNNLNYSISKTVSLFLEQLKLNSFITIVLSSIMLGIILYINRESKILKYIFIGINTILLGFILVLYIQDIVKFNYTNPLKNIYVYFFNAIIYLITCITLNKKIYQNKLNLILFILNKIGIAYSIIMTLYLKNITIIVIGNIFPQIFFGNILLIVSYIVLISEKILGRKNCL